MSISVATLNHGPSLNALCDILSNHAAKDIVVVRAEILEHQDHGKRILRFWYSRVSEGICVRQAGKSDDHIPQYPVEFNVPIWNTHVDTDMILAKFALVR